MRILYDHQIFEMQKIGGISRYFSELSKNNPSSLLSVHYSDNEYLKDKFYNKYNIQPKDYEYNKFFPNLNFKGKRRIFKTYSNLLKKNNSILSIDNLKKQNFDLFHPTYYDKYFLKKIGKKPFVITVFDMIHEIYPQYFTNSKYYKEIKYELIKKCSKIITISKNTKNDIIKFYPEIDEKKITITYLGSSFPIEETESKENYILYTGDRGTGYKNFNLFLTAIAPLLKKYNLKLICTGKPLENNEIHLFEELNILDKVICKVYPSEVELINLYKKALLFIFPSLYEGFGIPVLEAFSASCPAIISNTGSLPEVGGDAVIYFDPNSVDDMRRQIEQVIISPTLQNELILKGKERIKQFSWEKCVLETNHVYENVS